jgi:hypothetical protein
MIRNPARSLGALAAFLLFAPLPATPQEQPAHNVTGTWLITSSGSPLTGSKLVLQQEGGAVVGSFRHDGTVNGTFNPSQQLNGNWIAGGNNGWLTIWFTPDGAGFNGEWGNPGTRPSGTFVGRRFYPSVTGLWNFKQTGGEAFVNGIVRLTEQGQTVVGSYWNGTGQWGGAFATGSHVLNGTWKDKRGDGWINLTFAIDSSDLNGTWGRQGSSQPLGRMVGSPNTMPPIDTAGRWDATVTGQKAHYFSMTFTQTGNSIVATWPNGHVSGTLPAGSHTVHGTWQTPKSSGVITITFAADGNSFHGTWGYLGKPASGRILGTRV